MKRVLLVLMTVVLTGIFGIANAQNTQLYGFARTCFNGENWQNKFITFTAQNPNEVQAVSETLPELWAATYLDGYVWFKRCGTRKAWPSTSTPASFIGHSLPLPMTTDCIK